MLGYSTDDPWKNVSIPGVKTVHARFSPYQRELADGKFPMLEKLIRAYIQDPTGLDSLVPHMDLSSKQNL